MKRVRIGNDITILWSIYTKDMHPYYLENKDISLEMVCRGRRVKIENFTTSGNVLAFTFRGKDQYHIGTYTIVLTENKDLDNEVTVDKCDAFALTHSHCQTGDCHDNEECEHVEIDTVELQTLIDLNQVKPIIPEIGENGNWWIDGKDTGKPSRGNGAEITAEQIESAVHGLSSIELNEILTI